MAYIGHEPKSSHTIKYSQPLELVLFHVMTVSTNCHKGFHHPHLLNNYLFNYLNSSGLTSPTHKTFLTNLNNMSTPPFVSEALSNRKGKQAMNVEMEALNKKKT